MPKDPISSSNTGKTDDNATSGGGKAATTKDDSKTPSPSSGVVIPDEAKKKHPELVQMIVESESMNTEERNYWLQVLPVMTPDQITELLDILETEKRKLAAIDAKYESQKGGIKKQGEKELTKEQLEKSEKKRIEARKKRRMEEAKHREEESEKAEDLLDQLDEL